MDTAEPSDSSAKRGLFATCDEAENKECHVIGKIPDWLQGEVIRNGPGEFELGPDKFNHLFDGHAFLHKFSIEQGKAHYTGKFIKSKQFKHNHQHQRLLYGSFGTASFVDPCKNIFSRIFTVLTTKPGTDNTNVNVIKVGNAHYAITDSAIAYRFNPETLDTIKFEEFGRILNLPVATAHPHYDTNGDYYNVGISFGRKSFYEVVKIPVADMHGEDPLSNIQLHSKIQIDTPLSPSFYHSFGLTENYIVFYDQPIRMNLTKLMWATATWGPIAGAFEENKKVLPHFHVIDKASGIQLPTKYVIDPQLCFHFVNSYEVSSGDIKYLVVDMCCHSKIQKLTDPKLLLEKYSSWQTDEDTAAFKRFILPLNIHKSTKKGVNLVGIEGCSAKALFRKDGSVFLTPDELFDEELRSDVQVELPRINYNYNGKKYRYIYSTGQSRKRKLECLVKTDADTKQVQLWIEPDCVPSEPIFVARPNSTEEDDGIVLSTVVALQKNKPAFLLILDARSFKEIARAQISSLMSFSFHGQFHEKRD